MIEQVTPKYKFTCDRCGKEEFINYEPNEVKFSSMDFFDLNKSISKRGQVCLDCYKEFWYFAGNFFDEVNKVRD